MPKGSRHSRNDTNQVFTLRIDRINFGFPTQFRLTIPYRETISFGSVVTPQAYVFRANSPYDPNQTGSGTQPSFWDDMLSYYETSFTVGSLIELTIFNTGTTVPVQISLSSMPQSNTVLTYDSARLYPNTKTVIIDGSTKGGKSYARLSNSQETLKFFNTSFDRDYLSVGQAVSQKQFYWGIALQSADQTSTMTLILQVQIYYDVIFRDRKAIGLS